MGHRFNFAFPAVGLQEGFSILHSLLTPLPVLRSHVTPTEHASIAKTAVRITGAVGAIGLIVGMIFMLGALSDNPDGVGAGMAVALLTVLYGLVLGELFFGMVYYVSSQDPPAGDSKTNLPVAGLLMGFLSSMAGILMLSFVLYAISEV